jgi:hypothetical protein
MAYDGRREFRHGFAFRLGLVAVTGLFAAVAAFLHRREGWTWVSVGAAAGVAIALVGFVESLVLRVRLADDALVVTDLRGTRRYPIEQIERIREERGAPAAIRLVDGRWVRLPGVGASLGNSVRAWLKQSRRA